VFFGAPCEIFDLASFNFQVPMFAFWAQQNAPTKHSVRVNTMVLAFTSPPD
jgi:hypothetical protein